MGKSPGAREWTTIRNLFDELVDLPAAAREAVLQRPGLPSELRDEVRGLLRAADAAGDFLEEPTGSLPRGEAPASLGYSSLQPGAMVGPFRIERLAGRGGHGEVYEAHRADGAFAQVVALKLLRPEAVDFLERFRRERQILAGLEHPGIARLIDGGAAPDGRPYLAMEFVEGLPITRYARRQNLRVDERLALFQKMCAAVAYAHRHLVVHRDLKPGNVLVTESGEVKLLDFGVAGILGDGGEAQQTMALLTPQYAAPEQFEGARATTVTDVYALGAILFELLADEPAWSAGGVLSTAQRAAWQDPRPLGATISPTATGPVGQRDVRGDLEAIVFKAMRGDPDARYDSVQALSEDIDRHRAMLPVLARKGQTAYRARRFVRRNRGRLVAAAAVIVVTTLGVIGYVSQTRRAESARAVTRIESARAGAIHDYAMLTLRAAARRGDAAVADAKQALDRTAAELFRDGPPASTPTDPPPALLRAMAELQMEIGDLRSAEKMLQQSAEASERRGDPIGRAQADQDIAFIAIGRGDLDRAEQLLRSAQAVWARAPDGFARQTAEAAATDAALRRARGQHDSAIAELAGAIDQSRRLLGDDDEVVSRLQHNLSVYLLEADRVDDAARVIDEARRGIAASGRTRSTTAFAIQDQLATLALRRGDRAEAQRIWQEAIDRQKATYGPSMSLATMQLNLARLSMAPETAARARALIEDALAISVPFSGEASPQSVMLRQSLALALALQGEFDTARAQADAAAKAAQASFGAGAFTGLALLARAQVAFLAHDSAAAREDLAAARSMLVAAGGAGKPHMAALDALERALDAAR